MRNAALRTGAAVCLLYLLVPSPGTAAEKGDFVIIKNPRQLRLLDRFQQRLTSLRVKELGTFTPFRLVKKTELLGDDMTLAHRVTFRSKTYFMVLNEDSTVIGTDPDGFTVMKNCAVPGDTILIKKDKRVLIARGPGGNGRKNYLKKGDRYIREFKYRGRYYLTPLTPGGLAGWHKLPASDAWEKLVAREKDTRAVLNPRVLDRLRERITAANTAYRDYYDHFNRRTGDTRTPPRWRIRAGKKKMVCTWQGDPGDLEKLDRSTKVLLEELRNILLGKPFAVVLKDRAIRIEPEK